MSTLTREQKLYIAAGANAVFVVSLFLKWFEAGPFNASGFDAIPSGWVLLLFAAGAAGLLGAQAFAFDLPVRSPLIVAAYLSSVPLIVTLMYLLEGDGGRAYGLFIGVLASGVATGFATLIWKEEG